MSLNINSQPLQFEAFIKKIETQCSISEMIGHWMLEAVRVHNTSCAIYMSYIESKMSLVVASTVGFSNNELKDVGLDLMREEPGFNAAMLMRPERVRALHEFVTHGILYEKAWYYSLVHKDKVLGVFILPANKGDASAIHQAESSYLKMCLHMIGRELEVHDLQKQLRNNLIYDARTGVLLEHIFKGKLIEEVTRARRLMRPMSLVHLTIDGYDDLVLMHPSTVIDKILRATVDIFLKNSRLNDVTGLANKNQFMICLPHTSKLGAVIKAERLRKIFETADFSSLLGGKKILTLSLGISEYPSISNDVESLLKSSELAMHEAKKSGGNNFVLAATSRRHVPDFVVAHEKLL